MITMATDDTNITTIDNTNYRFILLLGSYDLDTKRVLNELKREINSFFWWEKYLCVLTG